MSVWTRLASYCMFSAVCMRLAVSNGHCLAGGADTFSWYHRQGEKQSLLGGFELLEQYKWPFIIFHMQFEFNHHVNIWFIIKTKSSASSSYIQKLLWIFSCPSQVESCVMCFPDTENIQQFITPFLGILNPCIPQSVTPQENFFLLFHKLSQWFLKFLVKYVFLPKIYIF